jgi:3-methyladenine DNA glycosylase AlkD
MSILPYIEICQKGQYRPEYGPMLIEAVRPHLSDKEFFVGKAVGWALRELSKHEPELVRAFIRENREPITPLALREGSRKL